jgi:hypothetical protein
MAVGKKKETVYECRCLLSSLLLSSHFFRHCCCPSSRAITAGLSLPTATATATAAATELHVWSSRGSPATLLSTAPHPTVNSPPPLAHLQPLQEKRPNVTYLLWHFIKNVTIDYSMCLFRFLLWHFKKCHNIILIFGYLVIYSDMIKCHNRFFC